MLSFDHIFKTDVVDYKIEEEIQRICYRLDTDTFLRDEERRQLLIRVKELAQQKNNLQEIRDNENTGSNNNKSDY